MKHLVLSGFIAPFPADDATADFIDLTEDQAKTCALIWAAGGAVSADFIAELDPEKVAEISALIEAGFAESAYGSAKLAAAAEEQERQAQALADAIKAIKPKRGK